MAGMEVRGKERLAVCENATCHASFISGEEELEQKQYKISLPWKHTSLDTPSMHAPFFFPSASHSYTAHSHLHAIYSLAGIVSTF